MKQYKIGSIIKNHCVQCFHDEQKVVEIVPKEFSEKIVEKLWTECTNCGKTHSRLVQHI
ncbi:hypothetical protein [Salimicrobium flavidum]|uniref:Uncharacterized protein n=1 Tax=Salimicrobium flavidum TaxID=570947 RepID=A0A1N7JAG7_9BACI|nr:hypothetical protein [Salimicrobium flavidum]SIS46277.1 hypothetical protein SAMN05421687_104267 [Salimicrobium flavidum]